MRRALKVGEGDGPEGNENTIGEVEVEVGEGREVEEGGHDAGELGVDVVEDVSEVKSPR